MRYRTVMRRPLRPLRPLPVDRVLTQGPHRTFKQGACVMEAVAWTAGEPHGRTPECACPVVTQCAIVVNDHTMSGPSVDALRTQSLVPLVPLIARSRATKETESARLWLIADFVVRTLLVNALNASASIPMCRDPAKVRAVATKLAALPRLTPKNRARAQAACREAHDVDRAAGYEVSLAAEVATNADVLLEDPDDFDQTFSTFAGAVRTAAYATDQASQDIRTANRDDDSPYEYGLAGAREVLVTCAALIRSMCELERASTPQVNRRVPSTVCPPEASRAKSVPAKQRGPIPRSQDVLMTTAPDTATAYYAAGQAVAHVLYRHKLEKVSVVVPPKAGRRCKLHGLKLLPGFDPNYVSASLAGPIAERMHTGKWNLPGAATDLGYAAAWIRAAGSLGPRPYYELDECVSFAAASLVNFWSVVTRVAKELVTYEEVTAVKMSKLVDGPVRRGTELPPKELAVLRRFVSKSLNSLADDAIAKDQKLGSSIDKTRKLYRDAIKRLN